MPPKAIAAAQREHFPTHTIIFLDQEEGGRLNDNQSTYLLAWTEAVARANYLPGVYASGQPVDDAPGKTITTIQNIRELVAAQHLHEIAFWVYQDACPPANGCTLNPHPSPPAAHPTSSLAVCSIPPPQGDHGRLRQNLRPRQQLLRPQPPQLHPGPKRSHYRRPIPRPLILSFCLEAGILTLPQF